MNYQSLSSSLSSLSQNGKNFFTIGALLVGLSVALGAFGAHALRERLTPQLLDTFETGVRAGELHLTKYITLLRFWLSRLRSRVGIPNGFRAGWLFVAGTILFSGSLYLLVLTNSRRLGAVTPLGGAAFIAGWMMLAAGVWQSK